MYKNSAAYIFVRAHSSLNCFFCQSTSDRSIYSSWLAGMWTFGTVHAMECNIMASFLYFPAEQQAQPHACTHTCTDIKVEVFCFQTHTICETVEFYIYLSTIFLGIVTSTKIHLSFSEKAHLTGVICDRKRISFFNRGLKSHTVLLEQGIEPACILCRPVN